MCDHKSKLCIYFYHLFIYSCFTMENRQHALIAEPSLQGSKFERTRQKLLKAVRDEVAETGDFNAGRVAERGVCSPANFYKHFSSKDEAFIAAYEQMMDDLIEFLEAECRIETLLDKGMEKFVAGWLLRTASFFSANAAMFRLAQPTFGRSRELRDLFREHEAATIRIYSRFIALGQAAGLIRNGDQTAMAQMLTVMTEGWHHSLVRNLTPNGKFHKELTLSFICILAPDTR